MRDPLDELRRQIEEEQASIRDGFSVRQFVNTADIELDSVVVPRGENLSGTVCLTAGTKGIWLDRVELLVEGVAKTAGSAHTTRNLPVARHIQLGAGETRRLPLWLPIPVDTALGQKRLMLMAGIVSAYQSFQVEPERVYSDVVRDFASLLGLGLASWSHLRGAEGVFAHLAPCGDLKQVVRNLGLDMTWQDGVLAGELVIDPPCPTIGAVFRSLIRPDRRRIPFRFDVDDPDAAEKLAGLLRSYLRRDLGLPIPAPAEGIAADDLPVPSGEPRLPAPTDPRR